MHSIKNAVSAGFTLIEVVVSMTMMALVSVVVLSALRNGLTIWDKSTNHLESLHRARVVHGVLFEQIRGALPLTYTVTEGETATPLFGFEGDRNHIRFVSRNSFKDGPGAVPRWIEIRWLANLPDGRGDLAAEERRILSPNNLPDSNIYLHENLLRADNCSFDFLKPGSATELPAWSQDWLPRRNAALPQAVRLSCLSDSKQTRSVIPLDYAEASAAGLVLR